MMIVNKSIVSHVVYILCIILTDSGNDNLDILEHEKFVTLFISFIYFLVLVSYIDQNTSKIISIISILNCIFRHC
jgi:hypothetical protein